MAESGGVAVVLVVSTDATHVESTARVLRANGHHVTVAASFEKARAILAASQPDLLIADVQLGAFNGLQLVWQRHFQHPDRPSIVTSAYADPVLEAEAHRLGSPFLIRPIHPHELTTVVEVHMGFRGADDRSAASDVDNRHWPRTLVGPALTVEMKPGRATLVDVSYGGCRLRFSQGARMPIAGQVDVPIPTLDRVITATPVWHSPVAEGQGDIYGLAVAGPLEAEQAWRRFVDAVGAS